MFLICICNYEGLIDVGEARHDHVKALHRHDVLPYDIQDGENPLQQRHPPVASVQPSVITITQQNLIPSNTVNVCVKLQYGKSSV